jgi:hypothetical protein
MTQGKVVVLTTFVCSWATGTVLLPPRSYCISCVQGTAAAAADVRAVADMASPLEAIAGASPDAKILLLLAPRR